jgi:hypothetical protein
VLPLIRFADRVEAIPATGLDLLEIPDVEPPGRLLPRLRSFDSIVSWYGAARSEFRRRVTDLRLPWTFFDALPKTGCSLHAVDFYHHQVQSLTEIHTELPLVPRIPCVRRDEGFAVIHPFGGSPAKEWPLERFRELAENLSCRMPVCWCAGPEDRLEGAVRKDDLGDLAEWIARARVFIGNDSGISHLAAAVGTPVVALFGPTDPSVWAPRGGRVAIAQAGSRMTDLPVSTVSETVWHLLR